MIRSILFRIFLGKRNTNSFINRFSFVVFSLSLFRNKFLLCKQFWLNYVIPFKVLASNRNEMKIRALLIIVVLEKLKEVRRFVGIFAL